MNGYTMIIDGGGGGSGDDDGDGDGGVGGGVGRSSGTVQALTVGDI